ncbi:hypothetical protein [Streptomyces sp. NPDC059063]|uniref:hypothetical protein n=1 Tax=unclassified Streptomyces TaxID=2593676 RepID=UPI00369A5A26
MRISRHLAAGVTAVALAVPAATPTMALPPATPALQPTCATPTRTSFPLDTRVRKGPATYHPGGGWRRWAVRLTNTTEGTCDTIHPVVVLVDRTGKLRAKQIQLEFRDGDRWRPVRFERTARDEHVGVFGDGSDRSDGFDGFDGFTAGPGETVTVDVRLAFTSDTAPDHVVASAAVVQRRDDDGDWVGESDDYPFDIVGDGGPSWPLPGELARTGRGSALGLGATAAALLLSGTALMAAARRLRGLGGSAP